MKVGVVETPGVLKLVEREIPKIKNANDVLVKVKRVGICGSDIHIFHGKNPFAVYPRVWGHEFVGEVVETGTAVKSVKKGDHVVVEPIISCGECYACRQGRGNVCLNLKVFGVHIDGGCAEYVVVPEANAHILPADLPWDEAALIEPFTIGAQACYRGNVQKGDYVLVMGAGTIGLTVAAMAKLYGAIVIVSDLIDDKLAYAKSRGADYTINSGKENIFDRVNEITGGMGANVTVDAVCVKKTFEDAILLTSVAGRVVELSFSETPSEIAPVNIIKKEISVHGSRLQTKRFPVVIDFVKSGKLPLGGFVSKVYPISQMAEAFDYTEKNNASVRKVLISFD
ncbi:MAG: zinc-binding alcohol dehydrogenase family protein [Spirochaetaceae bacterium]|jgi:L-gulonate 5-dehydrogenase|nr:zinc-binding alcohol dehydrogenase family protein [Spirochaetaceae bacterium]